MLKSFWTLLVSPLVVTALLSFSTFAQQQTYVAEAVRVQNYPDAPVELQIVSTASKPTESKDWFNTCFNYSVKNKTKRNFDGIHFEVLDKSGKAHVQGSVSFVLKPFEFLQSHEQCVANDAFTDEGFFTFRLTWVEQQKRTIWESKDHQKAVKQLFDAIETQRARGQLISSIAVGERNRDTPIIKKFITQQATEERGEEYEDARKVVAGDLNHDGVADLAVLYTIEGQDGTNNYIQYLAVFIRTRKGLVPVDHTVVGGKLNRDVDLQSIKRNVILLNTTTHPPNDTAGMPSRRGTARFVLAKRKLKQL